MQTLNDVHQQFASFFKSDTLRPYAWWVSKKLSEGHICVSLNDIESAEEELPFVYKSGFSDIESLRNEMQVSTSEEEKQPFVLHNNRLYLQRYFHYESIILRTIERFIEDEKLTVLDRKAELESQRGFIKQLFRGNGLGKTDWQMAAAVSCMLNSFSIITGGPGTGKTTTVAKILAVFFSMKKDLKVALAAPTGKAAMRMSESLKSASFDVEPAINACFELLEPSTIHRLLKYIPGSPYFKHNKENPLNCDVVIVDESSMIDVALFAKLLDAIGPDTRLILLGDKDQLASVEAGSLFGDLCQAQANLNLFSKERAALINSFADEVERQIESDSVTEPSSHPLFEHIVELQYSHRFKSGEGIGKFSKAIIRNDVSVIKEFFADDADQQVLIDTTYSKEKFEQFIQGYIAYIQEPDIKEALKKLQNLRILCAIRESEHGLYAINRKVEKYLSENGYITLKGEFYENRPIMMSSNNYSLGLFNGDVGIVRPDQNGLLKAWFETPDGELKAILPGLIGQAETVYAMTIHKSQGSEFNKVLMMLPSAEDISILTRELLYTGITRAKQSVLVQGKETSILQAAAREVKRASGLSERFKIS